MEFVGIGGIDQRAFRGNQARKRCRPNSNSPSQSAELFELFELVELVELVGLALFADSARV